MLYCKAYLPLVRQFVSNVEPHIVSVHVTILFGGGRDSLSLKISPELKFFGSQEVIVVGVLDLGDW